MLFTYLIFYWLLFKKSVLILQYNLIAKHHTCHSFHQGSAEHHTSHSFLQRLIAKHPICHCFLKGKAKQQTSHSFLQS